MIRVGSGYALTECKQLLLRCGLVLPIAALFFITGCSTMNGMSDKPAVDVLINDQAPSQKSAVEQKQNEIQEQAKLIAKLRSREKELEKQIRLLSTKSKAEEVTRESLKRRLEISQTAREDAIREVVRIRNRIQGMASQAEAFAMFAEARVIVDRMEEEAFSVPALEDLSLARSYMARGKGALDTGNPGGAAYLFDLIPELYEGMKKNDPRTVKVNVSVASLRKSPTKSSAKIGALYWGDSAIGIDKNREWMKVKTSSGQTGWLMRSQVL